MSVPASPVSGFRDPTALTRWVRWLLYAEIAMTVPSIISGVMEYQLFERFQAQGFVPGVGIIAEAEASDLRQRIVALVQTVVKVASGVAILMWIFRANKNARALGADLEISAGWSVGWYFIPIANLWKPYQAMKQIWQASVNPRYWGAQDRSPLLPWWWFFWLVSGWAGNIAFRFQLRAIAENANVADTVAAQMSADVAYVVSDLLNVPLCIIFLLIVVRIYDMQMRWSREAPPPATVTPAEPLPS
jgi:hypothetical protein